MSSRKALRDFYKLQGQAAPSSPQDHTVEEPHPKHDVNPLELEEEPLTALKELDQNDTDIHAFVHKLAAEQSLTPFIATVHQISREQAALTSAQRELVNDNYKKLIQAAETLGYLSGQGDLAGLNSLASSVQVIADVTQNIAVPSKSDSSQLRSEFREKLATFELIDTLDV